MTEQIIHFAAAHAPELNEAGNEAALAGGFAAWFIFALSLVISLRHFVAR